MMIALCIHTSIDSVYRTYNGASEHLYLAYLSRLYAFTQLGLWLECKLASRHFLSDLDIVGDNVIRIQ